MPDIVYTLAFSHLFSFNPSNALLLYEAMPSVRGFFEEQLLPPNLSTRLEQRLKEALEHKQELLDRAQRELDFCREKNIQVLAFNDPGYPVLLRQCPDAPLVLFYLGTASLNAPHTVAVVGTRRITDYGRDLCRHFCADLRQLLPDVVVVSGLAYGVDIHAHKAALEEGLPYIKDAIGELHSRGILTEEEFRTVRPDHIDAFFRAETGARAARASLLRREQEFLLQKEISGVPTVVQGIIDCWFEDQQGVVLIDYKNSWAPDEEAEAVILERYAGQVRLYREALEKAVGKPVSQAWLYLFKSRRFVNVPLEGGMEYES